MSCDLTLEMLKAQVQGHIDKSETHCVLLAIFSYNGVYHLKLLITCIT